MKCPHCFGRGFWSETMMGQFYDCATCNGTGSIAGPEQPVDPTRWGKTWTSHTATFTPTPEAEALLEVNRRAANYMAIIDFNARCRWIEIVIQEAADREREDGLKRAHAICLDAAGSTWGPSVFQRAGALAAMKVATALDKLEFRFFRFTEGRHA